MFFHYCNLAAREQTTSKLAYQEKLPIPLQVLVDNFDTPLESQQPNFASSNSTPKHISHLLTFLKYCNNKRHPHPSQRLSSLWVIQLQFCLSLFLILEFFCETFAFEFYIILVQYLFRESLFSNSSIIFIYCHTKFPIYVLFSKLVEELSLIYVISG